MYPKKYLLLFCLVGLVGLVGVLNAGGLKEESMGVIYKNSNHRTLKEVNIPEDFNAEETRAKLKDAKNDGNAELAEELALQLNAWWSENRNLTLGPMEQGSNPNSVPKIRNERHSPENGRSFRWESDVRIDPEDKVNEVDITSLSNGDLYTISVWDSSGIDHVLMHRSTDGGATWDKYTNLEFPSSFNVSSPGIIASNDTLITWYIFKETTGIDSMCAWVRVCLPGVSDTPLFWGSPTGRQPIEFSSLDLATDASVYVPEDVFVYATWIEIYGSGPDSTRVMNAVSGGLGVNNWELGPTVLGKTTGDNIYYANSRVAFGLDMMWVAAWLHPSYYPTIFDEAVSGWYSRDFGSTWSSRFHITPSDNGYDENNFSIAGSHINRNWVILCESIDTGYTEDLDILNYYCTDDTTWIADNWVTNAYENMLPDVWVDDNSNAFWAAFRQDRLGYSEEYVRVKAGNINNPTFWTTSSQINDSPYFDLSQVYGPSVGYNPQEGEMVTAWNSYNQSVYSIWFDAGYLSGVSEEKLISTTPLKLSPNPTSGKTNIYYLVKEAGKVDISLHDVTGRLIESILSEEKQAGRYSTSLNNENQPPGVYFLHLKSSSGTSTRKMVLLR